MIDNLSLSASEQLCAFLDGELEPTEASSLFFALAQSTELQEEMREHLGIKKLFSKSIYPPPDSLKMNILQTAGLASVAAPLNNTIESAGGKGFWVPLLKNRGFLVLSTAIVACLATLFYTNQNGNSGNIASSQSGSQITKEASVLPVNSTQTSNSKIISPRAKHKFPVVSSVANESQKMAKGKEKRNQLINSSEQTNNSIANNNSIISPQQIESFNTSIAKPIADFKKESGEYYSIFPNIATNSFLDDEISRELSLQIRSFTARSIPENQVAPKDENVKLNNMGISIFYHFAENISIGLEVGQENLLMKYSGIVNEKKSIIDENLLGFWWGLSLQYTMKNEEEFADLQPFFRLFQGGTRVGSITRGILGLQYSFADRVNMFGGIEGTFLLYSYQGTFFSTKKIGMTYGFGVNF